VPDLIDPFVEYVRLRLADDPHQWASTLLDELRPLGFGGSYQSLTAAIRRFGLRPASQACHAAPGCSHKFSQTDRLHMRENGF
jgi:hypothetical protein